MIAVATQTPRQLLVVCGAGRSGTSSLAGALKFLGAYIPQPEVGANKTNPRGHFEPKWLIDFQKSLLEDAGVVTLDPRPEAFGRAGAVMQADGHAAELTEWLSSQLADGLTVVKDPRTVWFHEAWIRSTTDLGADPIFVTMLRHPAEVVGSRALHYDKNAEPDRRLRRETTNLAGWVNVMLATERQTRNHPRSFVQYADLIQGWRPTMQELAARLDLRYDVDLSDGNHHPIDDFIDPNLRRSSLSMDDLDVSPLLREIAAKLWDNLAALVTDPHDADAQASNDALRAQYEAFYRHSVALATHDTDATAKESAALAVERAMVSNPLRRTFFFLERGLRWMYRLVRPLKD